MVTDEAQLRRRWRRSDAGVAYSSSAEEGKALPVSW
jgi:hypothetical protein